MVSEETRREISEVWTSAERMERLAYRLLVAFAFCIPWSIAASQTFLALAFAASLRNAVLVGRGDWRAPPLLLPTAVFLVSTVVGAVGGLDPWTSIKGLKTYLQLVAIYLVWRHAGRDERMFPLVVAFLAGMVLTSAHTLTKAFLIDIPRLFPGGMTESGQLLFAIGIATCLFLYDARGRRRWLLLLAIFTISLLINLKRGAWLGVFTTMAVIGLLRSPRAFWASLVVAVAAFAVVTPLRERLVASAHDFMLPGSRFDIWKAAVDVVERFPGGVGRKNGTILRDYPNVPSRHKHAHNNPLQMALENGVFGLLAFVWWMAAFFVLAVRNWRRAPRGDPVRDALLLAIVATTAGFHVAGMVEYNFGDTEVVQMLFVLMGFSLTFSRPWSEAPAPFDR